MPSHRRSGSLPGALAVLLIAAVAPTQAQTVATGDVARHAGLGGGGIALSGARVSTGVNPAAMASSRGMRLLMPRIGLSGQGERAQAVVQNLIDHGDLDHIIEVGFGLVRGDNLAWTSVEQGLRIGHLEIGIEGGGELLDSPNAAARQWARQGHYGIPPPNARLIEELGYHGAVPLTYGRAVDLGGRDGGVLELGIRLAPALGRYQRKSIRVNRKGHVIQKLQADLDGLAVGADFGTRYAPRRLPGWTLGLVLHGIAEGNIGPMGRSRSLDLGAAKVINQRVTGVADWLDAAGADRRRARFSAGAEWAVYRDLIVLRGAITTRGPSVGLDLGPLSLAYSPDGQSLIRTGIAF